MQVIGRTFAAVVFVSVFTSIGSEAIHAEQWTTKDGIISVTAPDSSRFQQQEPTPPMSVLWVSNDGVIRLAVVEIPMPKKNMPLIRSSLEKGAAEELHGKIVASSKSQQGNQPIFTMTVASDANGTPVFLSQSVAAVNGKAYKVMAVGVTKDTRSDPDAMSFVASYKIDPAAASGPAPTGASNENPQRADQSLIDALSQKIGGISLLVLIVCLAVVLITRKKGKA